MMMNLHEKVDFRTLFATEDRLKKELKKMDLENNIIKFLLECNKLMDGIYIEERTGTDENPNVIKFEAKLTCIYAQPGLWSPTEKFYEVLMRAGKKYLGVKTIDDFNFNNTHTIFWLHKSEVKKWIDQ